MGGLMYVAVDLDDVTIDFWATLCRKIEHEYDVVIPSTGTWEIQALKEATIFGTNRTWFDWLEDHANVWHTCPPVRGAIGGIDQLRRQGHYVEALTAKPAWAEWTVWTWLGKWRPAFNAVTIVDERNGRPKSEASGAMVLVDDRDKNCLEWEADGRTAILFSQPWNQHIECGRPTLQRAHDWHDVQTIIGAL